MKQRNVTFGDITPGASGHIRVTQGVNTPTSLEDKFPDWIYVNPFNTGYHSEMHRDP